MTLNWQAGKGLASSSLRRQALLYQGHNCRPRFSYFVGGMTIADSARKLAARPV
jgi:hypothetical protein